MIGDHERMDVASLVGGRQPEHRRDVDDAGEGGVGRREGVHGGDDAREVQVATRDPAVARLSDRHELAQGPTRRLDRGRKPTRLQAA